MSAANDILDAVKAVTEAAFTGKTCHLRRNSEKNPVYAADMTLPCFAASCNSDRKTSMAWAGKKFVEYVVELAYLTNELPGDRAASEAIEAVLDTASKLFLKPRLAGVAVVSDCEVKPGKPYTLPFDAKTVNASPLQLVFETIEDAN